MSLVTMKMIPPKLFLIFFPKCYGCHRCPSSWGQKMVRDDSFLVAVLGDCLVSVLSSPYVRVNHHPIRMIIFSSNDTLQSTQSWLYSRQ